MKPEIKEYASKIVAALMSSRAQTTFVAIALMFMTFVAGTAVMYFKVYPAIYFRNAFEAAKSLYILESEYNVPYTAFRWGAVRPETSEPGVLVYDVAKAYNGYTLFSSAHDEKASLMAMDGQILHEWRLPYQEFWDESGSVKNPGADSENVIRDVVLFPNGDLLALYIGNGLTPWGLGMAKMDKDSNLIWKYLEPVHHDLNIAPDGKIYTLSNYFATEPAPGLEEITPPFMEDYVVVLSEDGKELQRISLNKAIYNSPYRYLLDVPSILSKPWDPLHANSVTFITEEMARVLPFAEEGQVLISMRRIDGLAVLDLETEQLVWALRGPWQGQHDPDVLQNGSLLLFDNLGDLDRRNGRSRILEFNPITMEILWSYEGKGEEKFQSVTRGTQQRLPNGNTLINETNAGRLVEVTRGEEVVWKYSNPHRAEVLKDGKELIAILNAAQRVAPQNLDFEFNGEVE